MSNVQTANGDCPSTTDGSVDYEALLERFKAPISAAVEALRKTDAKAAGLPVLTLAVPALEQILDENLPKGSRVVPCCESPCVVGCRTIFMVLEYVTFHYQGSLPLSFCLFDLEVQK